MLSRRYTKNTRLVISRSLSLSPDATIVLKAGAADSAPPAV